MLRVHEISSFELPGLEPYRTLRRMRTHQQQRIFVAEGPKLVRRLLETNWQVVSVLLTREWLETLQSALEKRPGDIDVYIGAKDLLEQLTGYPMWHGIQAVARIPQLPGLEEILMTSPQPYLFAALDGISNSENVGVIVRNCVAFGVQAILIGETSSSPYLRRAVRSSMGAIYHLPVVELENLAQTLHAFSRRGIRTIAAHPHTEELLLPRSDLTRDCCIVLGSEGEGISSHVLEACLECVAIPMASGLDSLNVGSASAIFLYEAMRQRKQVPIASSGKCISDIRPL